MKSLKRFIEESMIEEEEIQPCSLETAHRLFDEKFKNFDIESIPLEVRRKAVQKDYAKIREIYWKGSWQYLDSEEHPEEEPIDESLTDEITSTRTVVEKLQKKFGMEDYQFEALHPYNVQYVKITNIPNYLVTSNAILFPDVLENVDTIIKEMRRVGYYKVREYTYRDKKLNCRWAALMFDPIHQDDIATQIRNNFLALYHFTPAYNHQSIVENGIVPKNEKRVYNYYQGRVYLVAVDYKERESLFKMMNNVGMNRKRNDSNFDGRFMLYSIKISLLPRNMKFYYDPHGENCVYTTETIPYSAIIDEEEIQI